MGNFNENELKLFGDFVEDEILKILQKKFSSAFNDNKKGLKNKKWDLVIPETKKTIEVKADYISVGTGNLLVEVVGWDGDAGLTTTEADYWVFVTGFRKIWITPLEIYRFIETHPNSHTGRKSITGKTDSYDKLAYKINHNDFIKYIYKLDKIKGHVDIISNINDPLFWFNCRQFNSDLNSEKQIKNAIIMAKELNINISSYDNEISSLRLRWNID
jgi:hypothetical protein